MSVSLGGSRFEFNGIKEDPAKLNKNQKAGFRKHGSIGGWLRSLIGKSFKVNGEWVNKNSFTKYVSRLPSDEVPDGVDSTNMASAKTARMAYMTLLSSFPQPSGK